MAKKKVKEKKAKEKSSSKKRKPGFEAALEVEAQAAEARGLEEEEKAGSPGSQTRPGSQATTLSPGAEPVSTIPPKAAKAIAPVLKIPFAIWAKIDEIPEIRLSQDEALEWAEPITDILEYYFPGKIPEIAWMWLMLLESTGRVIDSRIEIRHQKKKQLSEPSTPDISMSQGPDINQRSNDRPAPPHNGAEPAGGYPQG